MNPNSILPNGEKIRALRRNCGLTQQTLAKAAGIRAKRTIERIENGEPAYVSTIAQIAGVLGVQTREIVLEQADTLREATKGRKRETGHRSIEQRCEDTLRSSVLAEFFDVVTLLPTARGILELLLERNANRAKPAGIDTKQSLRLSCELLRPVLDLQDWRLRRVLGRCVARAIGNLAYTASDQKVLDQFTEMCSIDADAQVLLAQISGGGPRISERLGRTRILGALRGGHPQARWLLANHWNATTAVLSPDELIADTIDSSDGWMRRALLVQAIPGLLRESRRGMGFIKTRLQPLIENELFCSGPRFAALLDYWLKTRLHWSLSAILPTQAARLVSATARDDLRLDKWANALARDDPWAEDVAPEFVCTGLELFCLDMEMERPQISEITARGRGRYGVILQRVNRALNAADPGLHNDILLALLDAQNEGIRWAVAACLSELSPAGAVSVDWLALLARLAYATDQHPWVIREVLTSLCTHVQFPPPEASLQRIAETSVLQISRAVASGWPKTELYLAFFKFCQAYPNCASIIDIETRGDHSGL